MADQDQEQKGDERPLRVVDIPDVPPPPYPGPPEGGAYPPQQVPPYQGSTYPPPQGAMQYYPKDGAEYPPPGYPGSYPPPGYAPQQYPPAAGGFVGGYQATGLYPPVPGSVAAGGYSPSGWAGSASPRPVTSQPTPLRALDPVTSEPKPETYLMLSVFTCLCCSPIFGLIAICFAVAADSAYAAGDVAGARRSGRTALIVCVCGIVLTFVVLAMNLFLRASVHHGTG